MRKAQAGQSELWLLSGRSRAVAELTCATVPGLASDTDSQSLTVGRESTRLAIKAGFTDRRKSTDRDMEDQEVIDISSEDSGENSSKDSSDSEDSRESSKPRTLPKVRGRMNFCLNSSSDNSSDEETADNNENSRDDKDETNSPDRKRLKSGGDEMDKEWKEMVEAKEGGVPVARQRLQKIGGKSLSCV